MVAELLRANGYSLQVNAKALESTQHPERDAQFYYLNEKIKQFLQQGLPVISVDTKKKELIGGFIRYFGEAIAGSGIGKF